MRSTWFVVALAVAACGPSSAEINTAKTATYSAPGDALYRIALDTAAETYKIGAEDRGQLRFATQPQVYTAEGGRESAGAENYTQIAPNSVQLRLIVEIVPVGPREHAVKVTPKTFQFLAGSPQPRELTPDDPSLPPWVLGRVDSLQLEIYKHAKEAEAK